MQIYAISDDVLTPNDKILMMTKEILECGIKLFQYRCKRQKDEKLARELLLLCQEYGANFIINDDVDFAAKIGAKSVHIGKDDHSLQYAKSVLGDDAFIGVSCYQDIELAKKAEQNGASYVAFGAMFASPTKPNAPLCDINILRQAKQILKIPVCAIGGINHSNIGSIFELGVDYAAIITALYKPNPISQNIKKIKEALI